MSDRGVETSLQFALLFIDASVLPLLGPPFDQKEKKPNTSNPEVPII